MSADNLDPFALARQPAPADDSELFELIAEYKRREAHASERCIDDDERARRCDLSREILEQINATRPKTFAGVLAVLDLAAKSRTRTIGPTRRSRGSATSSGIMCAPRRC